MFLGFDSSTQSLSALLLDAEGGKILAEAAVNFGKDFPDYGAPSGFIPRGKSGEVHADPMMWLEAIDLVLERLSAQADLSQVQVIAGSGQQHGSVYVNEKFDAKLAELDPASTLKSQLSDTLTRSTSPIWMDTSTGEECEEIAIAMGGNKEVCSRTGSVVIERFTGSQIRKFSKQSPESYTATHRIHLVSSFIASVIAGKSQPIDFGDGAGMNLLNLKTLTWDPDLMNATAEKLAIKLLPATSCLIPKGTVSSYFIKKYGFSKSCQVCPFTGDNPASLVGMGATTPGQVVISLGTSDTFFAAMPEPKTDPQGFGHVFGNPAGGFMSLICFRNGSLSREAIRDELGVGWSAFEQAALSGTIASAGKNLTLPFYEAEITPRHDFDGPVTEFSEPATDSLRIRSLLEGQFLNMRLHSAWMEMTPDRILLTGGASKNNGIAQIVADVFQAPVERLEVTNSAALGAALIAATAAGKNLPDLQTIFCKPSSGSRIEPNKNLNQNYCDALNRYERLLQSHI